MIAAQQCDLLGKIDFQRKEENTHFDRVIAAVYIIAKEKHVRLGQVSVVDYFFEHMDHIVKLSMDVAHNYHWFLDLYHVCFLPYISKFKLVKLRVSNIKKNSSQP